MKVEFLMFWMRETLSNIRRNQLMSLLAISTVSLGLLILGTCFLFLLNLRTVVEQQTQKLDLVVFLKKGISVKRRTQLIQAARIPQVSRLKFVPAAQSLKELDKELTIPLGDFSDADNPLNDELRLKLHNPEDIFKVRNYFNSLAGVVGIRDDNQVVRTLLRINRMLAIGTLAALVLLGMAILLIIHNAIRLTIVARRREIRIMELVGATDWFIRMPFLLEGMVYGLAGAALAVPVLSALTMAIGRSEEPVIRTLMPLSYTVMIARCMSGMLLAGLVFGLLGSWISLSRSLDKVTN